MLKNENVCVLVIHTSHQGQILQYFLNKLSASFNSLYHLPAAYFCLMLSSSIWRSSSHTDLLSVLEVSTTLSHLQAFIYVVSSTSSTHSLPCVITHPASLSLNITPLCSRGETSLLCSHTFLSFASYCADYT